jgi:hypothetical protein
MPPTGLYYRGDEDKAKELISEEYGLLQNGRMVTRDEYDDGAASIGGQLVDIRGKAQLRVRYITPYNFVIAAHGSPINSLDFEARLTELLNAMLRGEDRLGELADEVHHLPRRFTVG